MQVKVDQFCTLATSPSWQAWLYHHHANLYRKFIHELQESRGCGQNREIMSDVLEEIDQAGGGDALLEFLGKHYPHTLSNKPSVNQQEAEHDDVFPYYNPNILTYPRRQIFVGPPRLLRNRTREFLLDKLKGDHIIIGERVYIEYLEKGDAVIADKIPARNWLISQYRLRHEQR